MSTSTPRQRTVPPPPEVPNFKQFRNATRQTGAQTTTPSGELKDEVLPFEPIAIVGVGIRAAGGIKDIDSLWDTLIEKKSHHHRLRDDPRFLRRFDPSDFEAMFSVTPTAKDEYHANLLDESPGVDTGYFGINKRDSMCMGVQQKLLLQVTHEALEDAGYTGAADGSCFDPSTFGCYIGAASDDYFMDPSNYAIDVYHLIRKQRAFFSGQISHHFGLHGPTVSVDTFCAGSTTAIDDGCRALAWREVDAAIVGGVHVMSPAASPPTAMALKLAGFFDPNGQCKPFMQDGAGYCRAEGASIFVLKRLSDAIKEGDRVHAVIKGTGVGSMSHNRSIVRPDANYQAAALYRAVQNSGIKPSDISFVEAHGPGTQQGDPAELASICSVLAAPDSRPNGEKLVIGSVKGNIGHAEAASGGLSLAKVLAMMRHETIPPQADYHPSRRSDRLEGYLNEHPIRIIEGQEPWKAERKVAVVNNFGASGFCSSLVLEGPPSQPSTPSSASTHELPFMVAARDDEALQALALSYADWVEGSGASVPLRDISFSTTCRRMLHPRYMLLHASSHAELATKLRSEFTPLADDAKAPKFSLAFCFPGESGPRVDPKTVTLYRSSVAFAAAVDECLSLAEEGKLFAEPDEDMLELFALEYGQAKMLEAWGLRPSAVVGHGLGEYVALVFSGVLSLFDGLKLVGSLGSSTRERRLDEFEIGCSKFVFNSTEFTFVSGQSGRYIEKGSLVSAPGYFQHLRLESSSIGPAIRSYRQATNGTNVDWMSLGTHGSVLGTFADVACELKVYSIQRRTEAFKTILEGLISLRKHSHAIGFSSFHRDVSPGAALADLPRYPMRLQPHTYPSRKAPKEVAPVAPSFTTVENSIPAEDLADIMRAHSVAGWCITPASVYMCLSLAAAAKFRTPLDGAHGFRMNGVQMHTSFVKMEKDSLRAHAAIPANITPERINFQVDSDHAQHANMQVELCDESRILSNLGGLKSLVWPLRKMMERTDNNILDTRIAYALFAQTVVYAGHCQGIQRAWIGPGGQEGWALSSNSPEEVAERQEYESAGFLGYSPILIDRACQIIGLMINIGPARASDEIFVASEIDSVEMAHDRVAASPSLWSYASFEIEKGVGSKGSTVGIGQVFTFDDAGTLVAAFRGVRMRKMKQSIVKKLVSKAAGGVVQPAPAPAAHRAPVPRTIAPRAPAPSTAAVVPNLPPTAVVKVTRQPAPVPASKPPPRSSVPAPQQTVVQTFAPPPVAQPTSSPQSTLRDAVMGVFSMTLDVSVAEISMDKSLADLGLDSLTAVEAGSEIERLFPNVPLPPELLGEGETTIPGLFKFLGIDGDVTAAIAPSPIPAPTPVQAPAQVASLPTPVTAPAPLPQVGGNDTLRNSVLGVFRRALGTQDIPITKKLSSLGLDSLTSVELAVDLENLVPDKPVNQELLADEDTTMEMIFGVLSI